MTIERLGPIDPVQKFNKTEKPAKPNSVASGDSIALSDEAKLRAEIAQAVTEAQNLPDIRQDRIDAVREQLQNPTYIDDRVVDIVADEIMSVFGLD